MHDCNLELSFNAAFDFSQNRLFLNSHPSSCLALRIFSGPWVTLCMFSGTRHRPFFN